jgi:hypothetical protein
LLPIFLGLAMAMSSVTNVLGNSVLLVRYKPRFAKKPETNSIPTRISKGLILCYFIRVFHTQEYDVLTAIAEEAFNEHKIKAPPISALARAFCVVINFVAHRYRYVFASFTMSID